MFFFITKVNSEPQGDVEALCKELIAQQQRSLGREEGNDTDPERIQIHDYAYVQAQPDGYLLYANWTA